MNKKNQADAAASREGAVLGGAAAAAGAAQWQTGLNEAVEAANRALADVVAKRGAMDTGKLQGFMAEHWHVGTFNVDAYKKGVLDVIASAPDSNAPASFDIILERAGELVSASQAKYYRSGVETAKQLWNPAYDNGTKLVPADQLNEVIRASQRAVATDHRPHVVAAAEHTTLTASDRLKLGRVESTPLERKDASTLTERVRAGEDGLSMRDALPMGELAWRVGLGGAIGGGIGFAIGAAPKLLEAIANWRRAGKIDDKTFQLVIESGGAGAHSGAWGSLQGAVSSAMVHLAARGTLGKLLQKAGPGPIAAASVVALQALRDGAALYRGDITRMQFAGRVATNGLVAGGSVAGAAAGQALIPIPLLGSFIGAALGGLLARVGVAIVGWTANALWPHVRDAATAVADVAFQWDLLREAKAQSAELARLFEQADASVEASRRAAYQLGVGRIIHEIDVQAITARTAMHLVKLDAAEQLLAALDAEVGASQATAAVGLRRMPQT